MPAKSRGADRVRHPAVGDASDTFEREGGATGAALSAGQAGGICRQPDRARRLHRLRFQRDAAEADKAALERFVVARPKMAQHVDVLDHAAPALSRRDVHCRRLGIPRAAAAARTHRQPGAAMRQHVERGPFVGEHTWIAQCERSHAGGAEKHGLGAAGQGSKQSEGIERGLTNRASPTHSASSSGEVSTASANASNCFTVVRPSRTPRLASVMPKRKVPFRTARRLPR